jgi:hypothetical protein
MASALSFDELLELAALDPRPIELEIKSLGRSVLVRNPSSGDVDKWRYYAARNQDTGKPMSAKLVQLMLCDQFGERVIPQTDEGLAELAKLDPKVIDEIAMKCMPFIKEPTEEEVEKEKNS